MVTLVVAKGIAYSLDLYVEELAQKLDVPMVYADISWRGSRSLGSWRLLPDGLEAMGKGWQLVRSLNRRDGIVHLPHHHLGRYGLWLKVPYIITVHDLALYLDLKAYGTFIYRPNLREKIPLSLDYRGVKKARRIITVSEATKHDLVHYLGIPEEKITVVYEGIDHQLFQPTSRRLVDYPYLLFVGSEHPTKNFPGLLKAFSLLKSKGRFKDLKLVKVGRAGGARGPLFRRQTLKVVMELRLSDEVVFTGYVAREDLPAYYSGAECLILPSFYEGFGFPPLEAMACGCPVIVSNVASLPEVSGEAAIKVDPNNADSLASALELVLTDEHLKREMVSKGFERAKQFSWERAARETLGIYREVENSLRSGMSFGG